jgi:hypothetical protein
VSGALPIHRTGTNIDATSEAGEPIHGGSSVWYRWTATMSGRVTVDTCGSSFNTNLGVYTGTSVNALTTVGGNRDACGPQSMSTFAAQAGTQYHIAVSGDPSGDIVLTIQSADPPPGNDGFAEARALPGRLPITVNGTNLGAGPQPGEPAHSAAASGGTSIWYRWTATHSGPVVVDTCESSFSTQLAVYTGGSVDTLTSITSDSDGCQTFSGVVTINAVAGTEYRIAVDGDYGDQGAVVLTVREAHRPANDSFTGSRQLHGDLPAHAQGTNVDATWETGEPQTDIVGEQQSVWYRWTPTSSGPVTMETCGSEARATILTVWTGDSLEALRAVPNPRIGTCGRGLHDTVTFAAVAGTTYRLSVDAESYPAGSFRLTIRGTRPPANDNLGDAEVLDGRLPIRAHGSNVDATREPGEPTLPVGEDRSGPSVWYQWTPRISEQVTVETCGSSFRSQFAVYSGSPEAFTQVARPIIGFDSCGDQDRATFQATAGTAYWIGVDGVAFFRQQGDQGSLQLAIRATSRPANDSFADATALSRSLPLRVNGSTTGATHETGEPFHLNRSTQAVWYRWTPPRSEKVVIETCDSEIDTLMVVYTGTAINTLTSVAASENQCGEQSSVVLAATAGTTYWIAVDSWGSEGGISLEIRRPDPPGNDNLANARRLGNHLPVSVTGTNRDATREAGEPRHAGEGSGSVWYRWTPQRTGEVTVDTTGTPFITSIGVYTGTTINGLTRVATGADSDLPAIRPSTNRVTFLATAGTEYLIAVDGNGLGFGQLDIDPGPAGPIKLTINTDRR